MSLERRTEIALALYVSKVDDNLAIALRSFLPDDIWQLLRGLHQAERGVSANRASALREGEAEYRSHADQFVLAWRDFRRLRERLLVVARERGVSGFQDPAARRYLNSGPIESEHFVSLASVETLLLDQAAYRIALWLSARKHLSEVRRARHRVGTRREIVALLAHAGLGYERVASLATSSIWRIPPCPSMTRERLVAVLKADRRIGRRRPASRLAPVEL